MLSKAPKAPTFINLHAIIHSHLHSFFRWQMHRTAPSINGEQFTREAMLGKVFLFPSELEQRLRRERGFELPLFLACSKSIQTVM